MINKIIKKIKNYFSEEKFVEMSKRPTNSELYTIPKDANYLLFYITPDETDPAIKIGLSDLSETSCKNYAEMLFNIFFGFYQNSTSELLKDMSKEDEDIDAFVKNMKMYFAFCIQDFQEQMQKRNDSDEPLIPPTSFQTHVH
jgi:hypothetical protein